MKKLLSILLCIAIQGASMAAVQEEPVTMEDLAWFSKYESQLREEIPGLEYNLDSVIKIDAFVEKIRHKTNDSEKDRYIQLIGSFLGQSLVNEYKGKWIKTNYGMAVVLPNNKLAFPFNKVAKQFFEGSEHSIAYFYGKVPEVISGSTVAR